MTLVRETLPWHAGGITLLSLLPSEKSCFYCHIILPFSQGQGENQLSGLGHLILPQHYASVEKKKKIRPRNGPEIQCLPRLKGTQLVPSRLLFSNENGLYN